MKRSSRTKQSKDPVATKNAHELLAEAMKQPGVKAVMDVFDAADKYHRQTGEFANYIDWQRFPSSFSSCETTPVT